jgi:hypothetical protein
LLGTSEFERCPDRLAGFLQFAAQGRVTQCESADQLRIAGRAKVLRRVCDVKVTIRRVSFFVA